MNKIKIFCFGNPYIEHDAIALELANLLASAPELSHIEFVKCETPDPLLEYNGEKQGDTIFIMDVVRGIKEVSIIEDIDLLEAHSLVSMHDFDLGFFLKLIKAASQVNKVCIIGIPYGRKAWEVKKEVDAKLVQLKDRHA